MFALASLFNDTRYGSVQFFTLDSTFDGIAPDVQIDEPAWLAQILTTLGSTGMAVSLIGLGTVKLGRNSDVKYPSAFELPSDDDARALLDAARALGVNLLDTAPAYGSSEARLGALLEGQRDDWLICTKAGEIYEGGQSRYDFTEQHIRASVDASLKRLRTDRVDILLLHSDGRDEEIIEQFHNVEKVKLPKARRHETQQVLAVGSEVYCIGAITTERGRDLTQRAIVHVHHAAPYDASAIDLQLVAPVDVIVDHR